LNTNAYEGRNKIQLIFQLSYNLNKIGNEF
jgi:hypothetical protein